MTDHIINDPFHTDHAPGTPIDWFLQRMTASGIPESIAQTCGFRLIVDDDGAYFTVPYFTVDGVETTHQRQRNREEKGVRESVQSGGNHKGKYTQKKGSKNHVYWPPVYSQRTSLVSPHIPLIVCEGELKSIQCQMKTTGSAIPALVCGVPGTRICKQVEDDLAAITCMGRDLNNRPISRTVYIAADWNGKGEAKDRGLDLEFRLRKIFQALGARVVLLRWEPKTEGEQKLDDWLVAGGDLGKAMDESLASAEQIDTEISLIWDHFNSNYAIYNGKYVPLRDINQLYTPSQFGIMEGYQRIMVTKTRTLGPVEIWNLQPPEQRNMIDGYKFYPSPLGHETPSYVWKDGLRYINTAPKWSWLCAPYDLDEPPAVAPFLELVARLCQEGMEWFINFLAQGAQQPTIRGPHIVIFKDNGGTGKSLLFQTMDLVFGDYCGPCGAAMTSKFNAGLEKLLFAWWSDPHFNSWMDLEPKLKGFSGDSKMEVERKYGAQYSTENYGRLLIATNKDWIVPIHAGERRYTVFGGLAPLHHTDAAQYMSWLLTGGVDEIRRYLVEKDLSSFDIQAPGPSTQQRMEMEGDSAHPLIKLLSNSYFQTKDIWSVQDILMQYNEVLHRSMVDKEAGKELKRYGLIQKQVAMGELRPRLWAIRNVAKWNDAPGTEWVKEYKIGAKKHEG